MFVHSDIFFNALLAAVRLLLISGLCGGTPSDLCSVLDMISARTSRGYNFAMGLFVWPVEVRKFAARIRPSFPVMRSSITASFHFILGLSSWIKSTSPTRMVWLFFPVVL